MVRGLYTAYTGMLNQQYRLDTITNNLANASTTGFKSEGVTSRAFENVLAIKIKDGSEHFIDRRIGTLNLGVKIGENYTDYDQGPFKNTENTYDLALEGNGFFAISFTNKSGVTSTLYTRDGEFVMDQEGALRTKEGDYVLGQGGEIYIPTDAVSVGVDSQGNITADGMFIDRIQLTDFEDYDYLKKYGENLYIAVDGATQINASARVHQGYLEASNVNVVEQMVDMINIARAYESNQKVIQAIDGTLEKAVNDVGRV